MVYVNTTKNELNKYLDRKFEVQEIKNILIEIGMDLKGEEEITQNGIKDIKLKIEITAEKMDLINCIGIARAINFYTNENKELKNYKTIFENKKVIVSKDNLDIRPYTAAFCVKNLNLDESKLNEIIELQEKLHDSFCRNRKKAAIGIYPTSKIKFPIYFQAREKKDINFHPLFSDRVLNFNEIIGENEAGRKYFHLVKDLKKFGIFCDANNKILSLTPIINSYETGRVTIDDKDLFVEVSGFNKMILDNIAKILATNFIEIGGVIEEVEVNYEYDENYRLSLKNRIDTINLDYISKIIGRKFEIEEIKKLLNKMMYKFISFDKKSNEITFEIPCFKTDAFNDCDVADDIARGYGYNNLIPKYPKIDTVGKSLEKSNFKDNICEKLVSMGFLELYTFMLTSKENQFIKMNLNEKEFENDFVKIRNSAEDGINMTRLFILPEILTSLNFNRKNKYPQMVFESGYVIKNDDSKDTLSKNISTLCSVIADPKSNYTQIKNVLDTLSKLFEIDFEIKEFDFDFLIKGRSAKIFYKKKEVGFIGEVSPNVISNFGLLVPVSVFEINLDLIFENLN